MHHDNDKDIRWQLSTTPLIWPWGWAMERYHQYFDDKAVVTYQRSIVHIFQITNNLQHVFKSPPAALVPAPGDYVCFDRGVFPHDTVAYRVTENRLKNTFIALAGTAVICQLSVFETASNYFKCSFSPAGWARVSGPHSLPRPALHGAFDNSHIIKCDHSADNTRELIWKFDTN